MNKTDLINAGKTGLIVLLLVGGMIGSLFLFQIMLGSMAELNGGEYRVKHNVTMTIKEKFTASSLLDGTVFFVVDENNDAYEMYTDDPFNDWVNMEIGKTYDVQWWTTARKMIIKIY